jgi:Uma2 family endonuclease
MEEMATLPQAKTVTYEEWLAMPEVEDAIEEVVNGEIRIMPPAKSLHAKIIARLNRALDRQLDPDRTLLFCSSFGLIIRKQPLTSRVPELAVFQAETVIEKDGYFHSAPQLAVEVLSPANTRRKLQEKLADYAEIGVAEVWVISPEARTVELLILESGQLVRAGLFSTGDILKPRPFPHVQVDIAQIWPD